MNTYQARFSVRLEVTINVIAANEDAAYKAAEEEVIDWGAGLPNPSFGTCSTLLIDDLDGTVTLV